MYLTTIAAAAALAIAPSLQPAPISYTPAPVVQSPVLERSLHPFALPTTAAATVELSVLTYNVHGLPWPLTKNRTQAMRAIGRELALMRAEGRQPDVVLIQEAFGDDADDLVKLSGYRYWARGPNRGDRASGPKVEGAEHYRSVKYPQYGEGWGKLVGAGLYVLSDQPILQVRSTPYRHCAGLDCLANKGVMLAQVAVPGVPGGVDILNTHLNSKRASRTPLARSLAAHNLQVDELLDFLGGHRDAGRPLLVGGDFNVKNAPERYDHKAALRPFTVVSEYCNAPESACDGETPGAARPWLASQDLQAFESRGSTQILPIKIQTLFDSPATGGRLSDHAGYLVRYRLSTTDLAPSIQTASAAP